MRTVGSRHGADGPAAYKTTVIPIEKSLLFRTNISKGNPEGQSACCVRPTAPGTSRSAWRSSRPSVSSVTWLVCRWQGACGVPEGAKKGTKQAKTVDAFRKMVRGVRRDENEGLVLPSPVRPGHQAAALRLRADEPLAGSGSSTPTRSSSATSSAS
jgi:hypothetical protein